MATIDGKLVSIIKQHGELTIGQGKALVALPGQLYVALSRCTSIEKTHLESNSKPIVSEVVSRFYKNSQKRQLKLF